ncbi:MAG: N-acetyl-gamma-glutamyl-phosphate reductase [Clostridiales bacterium]|nr:N-acetyl-gamma-glutamyl-phosphate reductase [Clostridiales bacterium]
MPSIFIDGSAGTTGLRIRDRLASRKDLTLITLPEESRKDPEARKAALNEADVAFLCLPDDAAREAVSLLSSPRTVLIDTSTAHRVAPGWVYGFPELPGQRDRIRSSRRIANPGCHATGFISLVEPLVSAGILKQSARLSCFSLTGYSGGGKKMIAEYEAENRSALLQAPRQYGLSQGHKHLPEMAALCGLEVPPVFSPVVAPYYAGMEVTVPLTDAETDASPEEIAAVYRSRYTGGLVRYADAADESGFLSAGALAGRDDLEVAVFGRPGRILLVSRFDNLGKGASGAAIQNMNLVLGLPEGTGLKGAAGWIS